MATKTIQPAVGKTETDCVKKMHAAALCADVLSERAGYRRGPPESHTDAYDRLTARLDAAEAMLIVSTNDDFMRMSKTIQANYFSAIQDLISAARVDARLVIEGRP